MSKLRVMQAQVVAFIEARDWRQFHTPTDFTAAFLKEAMELAELLIYQRHINLDVEKIAEEIADVVYHVLAISHYAGIELSIPREDTFQSSDILELRNGIVLFASSAFATQVISDNPEQWDSQGLAGAIQGTLTLVTQMCNVLEVNLFDAFQLKMAANAARYKVEESRGEGDKR